MKTLTLFACLLAISLQLHAVAAEANGPAADPYLEYENVDSPLALAWVKEENAKTLRRLAGDPLYRDNYQYILKELNADDRIVVPSLYRNSEVVRNFWRDDAHPQGYIRQTDLEHFFAKDYRWRTVLDIDALSKAEGKTWVLGGSNYPYKRNDLAMLALSDGGKDAEEYREYNFVKQEFVKDGFFLPESKSGLTWLDPDTLLVSSAFGEDEVTESGYPRIVKKWKRGTPFAEAETIFSVGKEDLRAGAGLIEIADDRLELLLVRIIDFYNYENFLYDDGKMRKLLIPSDASFMGVYRGQAILSLKTDWETGGKVFRKGSVIHCPYEDLVKEEKDLCLLYEPAANSAVEDLSHSRDYLYLTITEDVKSRIFQYEFAGGAWSKKEVPLAPMSAAYVTSVPRDKGFILFHETGFLHPPQLFRLDEKSFEKTLVQSLPARFNPDDYRVSQHFATSLDGTKVPYFSVHRKDLVPDGNNPVLQYGYGGFMNTELPGYHSVAEHTWMRKGGVYVVANIRGGGEYGPAWHDVAVGAGRHKSFEDFIAVSEDLVKRGVTSPKHLGILGGSNGGLLVGAVMVMRPDLYNAAVIQAPLLDMLRYHKLPPGASWMGEYGNPDDPAVAPAIRAYSPYQNLRKGVTYPAPFLATSAKDDRVHPGHARKFAKRLEEYGQDFYYYEELEGGHSGSANYDMMAKTSALVWVYLTRRLMPGEGGR